MTTGMIVLLVIGGIIAIVALWFMSSYNNFIRLKALLDEAWSGINVQLKRRYDLIPNLVETVKGYSIHEKSVLEDVVRLRSASMGATSIEEKSTAEEGLSKTLKTLFAVAEQYPNLKANENFLSLQKDLGAIEQDIQLARRYYNGTARNYNVAATSFPSNIVASIFGFAKVPYFELAAPEEGQAPKVKF